MENKTESKPENRHKGTYVGGHLYDRQVDKFGEIMRALADATGTPPNAAATLRYVIEHFDLESSPLAAERRWDELLADPRSAGALAKLADEARTTPENELTDSW
jgi:hypothetical protein